jgi:hypothetical protein
LRKHPQVFLPQPELHYWTTASLMDDGHSWYRRQFVDATPGQVVGERSNSYLIRPGAADTIHRHMPDARLVAMLRNPIDRAYSGYCMRLRGNQVTREVERYLDPERSVCPEILQNSLYSRNLQPYLDRFPRRQIHFVIFDDIEQRPAAALSDLCGFLGIAPLADEMLVVEKVNPKERLRLPRGLNDFVRRYEGIGALRDALRATPLVTWMRSLLQRETAYPPLPHALRLRLAVYFQNDIEQLSEIVGRDLRHWVTGQRMSPPDVNPNESGLAVVQRPD